MGLQGWVIRLGGQGFPVRAGENRGRAAGAADLQGKICTGGELGCREVQEEEAEGERKEATGGRGESQGYCGKSRVVNVVILNDFIYGILYSKMIDALTERSFPTHANTTTVIFS